ncbi:MAG: S-layer homology domain-containing protein [Leptolyngbya sp. SIO4C1]|nr:S-layer homology domain-containing protein [Leptolyngbya sp. SIO4C1]
MSSFSKWQSGGAALAALGLVAGAAAPLVYTMPASAQQTTFSDVSADYWARPFIQRLADRNIIAGFPDGTFGPNQPVTRAQFAAIVQKAFSQPTVRDTRNFSDVAADFWAQGAIQNAYRIGFLSGYPDGTFQPNQEIPRVQVLVSLSNGLGFSPAGSVPTILSTYQDQTQIPQYAVEEVAAATQNNMIVNYPNINQLNPQGVATRADVAAFVHQALVSQGKLPALDANVGVTRYIVGYTGGTTNPTPTTPGNQNTALRINRDAVLDLRYPNAADSDVDVVVAPGQTVILTLEVASAVQNSNGQTLIPVGSTVQGRIVPVNIRGSDITAAKFVADRLMVGNQSYPIQAESDPIAASETVNPNDIQGALVTTAAQSILGNLLGNRNLGNIVGQVIVGDRNTTTQNAVIVVDPNELDLRVMSEFFVNAVQ